MPALLSPLPGDTMPPELIKDPVIVPVPVTVPSLICSGFDAAMKDPLPTDNKPLFWVNVLLSCSVPLFKVTKPSLVTGIWMSVVPLLFLMKLPVAKIFSEFPEPSPSSTSRSLMTFTAPPTLI